MKSEHYSYNAILKSTFTVIIIKIRMCSKIAKWMISLKSIQNRVNLTLVLIHTAFNIDQCFLTKFCKDVITPT